MSIFFCYRKTLHNENMLTYSSHIVICFGKFLLFLLIYIVFTSQSDIDLLSQLLLSFQSSSFHITVLYTIFDIFKIGFLWPSSSSLTKYFTVYNNVFGLMNITLLLSRSLIKSVISCLF